VARSGSRHRVIAEINVVPYIDVMLVLLIIFMVSAPLLKQGVEVDLPTAPANALDLNSPDPIIVSVDKEGLMYISESDDPDTDLTANEMIDKVRAALAVKPLRPVLVRGDANGPYNNVVKILVLLQQAEVGSVGLVTEPEAVQ
jgi:biopolymer transport protein TolR